jgi:septation ring formation regulator EzrA
MTDLKEKILKLDDFLGKQRLEWTQKIKELADNLKIGINLEEVSSYTLSYRQILVEHLASMSNRIRTQKTTVDKRYKEKWLEYYNYDYKLTDKQKEKFIEADIADENHMLELLQSQKSFLEGSIKTLDNMGFAIKNRLDMSRI